MDNKRWKGCKQPEKKNKKENQPRIPNKPPTLTPHQEDTKAVPLEIGKLQHECFHGTSLLMPPSLWGRWKILRISRTGGERPLVYTQGKRREIQGGDFKSRESGGGSDMTKTTPVSLKPQRKGGEQLKERGDSQIETLSYWGTIHILDKRLDAGKAQKKKREATKRPGECGN